MATSLEQEMLLSRLAAAPAHFQALMARLEAADSITTTAAGEWSPHEVVAHMRAANDILEPRVLQVLVRPNTPLIGFDEDRWLQVLGYMKLPVTDLLQTMAWRRKELVNALRNVPSEEWDRSGIHEVRGPMTVYELATQIAEHEDDHLSQIARVVGDI
ncbi:MAG: DinB family protein [Chloroflexota bacterium]